MAERLISPGVLLTETDKSFIQINNNLPVGPAIIGPTAKGRKLIPTMVGSYSEYENKFGSLITSGSDQFEFFTSIAARNYFNNGGQSLLVVSIGPGDGSPSGSVPSKAGGSAFTLEALNAGTIMNNSGSAEASGGVLPSGSRDNIRWEVSNVDSGSKGTFDLIIRRGDDTTNNKIILEQWKGLSLNPNDPNYILSTIGDQKVGFDATNKMITFTTGSYTVNSKYVRISSINPIAAVNFDVNSKIVESATGSLPSPSSSSFNGGTNSYSGTGQQMFYNNISSANIQGFDTSSYTDAIALLSNTDEYDYNLLIAPGLNQGSHSSTITSITSNTANRGDALFIADMGAYGANLTDIVSRANAINSSYIATYWTWVQVRDALGKIVWVPASTMIPGVYANNDRVGAEWFAPAGFQRGGIVGVVNVEKKLSPSDKDSLYAAGVNPIAFFPNNGIVIYGQKTLQKNPSALDRVNVRRLLINLKRFTRNEARNLVFEQNTTTTRDRFLKVVNPYLESVVRGQGLFAFQVIMDSTNNTADVIDRNELVGQILLQPTKAIEFISIDFTITPTGVVFNQ
jgi:phage tail sheath protein FI